MARNSRISMVFHRPMSTSVAVETNAYEIKPEGRWAWLQLLAWRFLRKTSALKKYWDLDETITYERITFNTDEIIKQVFESRQELLLLGYRPKKILIGPSDLSTLMKDRQFLKFQMMNRTTEVIGTAGFNAELFGLPIEIVPHMKGVLIL